MVNNYSWYKNMSALEFVGRIGRYFRMGTMLAKESVKARLGNVGGNDNDNPNASEEGMSFTEFSYQIFQVQPSLELFYGII